MTEKARRTTIVNHVATDIAVSPDRVWRTILEEYVQARKFRELGYTVEPLDDPATPEGGYRLRLEQDGVLVDGRICRITELDERQRRLSMFGDCSSAANEMVVYATYHAAENLGGTRYAIDCHSSLNLDLPGESDSKAIMTTMDDLKCQFDAALMQYLDSLRTKLESEGR